MTSLLLISPEAQTSSRIERVSAPLGITLTHAQSAERATELLSIQNFDFVFVDSELTHSSPLQLLTLAWKYNPRLIGAVFNLIGAVPDEWSAKLLGARVFSGPGSLRAMRRTLSISPSIFREDETRRVLLVEDLDAPREILCNYISAAGYTQAEPSSSAEEALAKLRDHPRDYFAVVTDLNMPHINGARFIEQLRADDRIAHLPVIVLTAYPSLENLIHCVAAGASGFLSKPPSKKNLRFELEKARRIIATNESPRICRPEDAHLLEAALMRLSL